MAVVGNIHVIGKVTRGSEVTWMYRSTEYATLEEAKAARKRVYLDLGLNEYGHGDGYIPGTAGKTFDVPVPVGEDRLHRPGKTHAQVMAEFAPNCGCTMSYDGCGFYKIALCEPHENGDLNVPFNPKRV